MDTSTFDAISRRLTAVTTRRSTLTGLLAGAAVTSGLLGLGSDDASARRKKKRKNQKKNRKKNQNGTGDTSSSTTTLPPVNVCAEKNWCVDRSQTCGPAGGYGKCLVTANGGNLCAEILFQASSCSACAAPQCTNCQCVLAAGGGDRCNNGATGHDFICVRAV